MSDETNLILSYTVKQDHGLHNDGHVFLGVAHDDSGDEVHVFLRKGHAVVGLYHNKEKGPR